MRPNFRSNRKNSAFTLLELVVVLAILAVVTAIAARSLSNIEDQRRFEASQRGLTEIQTAVVGLLSDRAPDGTQVISGFVADMGRLPQTVEDPPKSSQLKLSELWNNPGAIFDFDVRQAKDNGVATADTDPEVYVPGGWRGPYLQLAFGATNLQDAWGNGYNSSSSATSTDYARLRDGSDGAITLPGQLIAVVRHLGADGSPDSVVPPPTAYDRDRAIAFLQTSDQAIAFAAAHDPTNPIPVSLYGASLTGSVEVLTNGGPAAPDNASTVSVRVFAPNPANSAQISVYKIEDLKFTSNPVHYTISSPALTIGPRIVRAYFYLDPANVSPPTQFNRSAVKTVMFRPGTNFQDLTIDRKYTPPQ